MSLQVTIDTFVKIIRLVNLLSIVTLHYFSQVCAQDLPDELFKPRLSGCTEIGIQTTNINDACPLFQDFPVFTVPENQNEEVVIFESIQATDFDDDGGTQTPRLL